MIVQMVTTYIDHILDDIIQVCCQVSRMLQGAWKNLLANMHIKPQNVLTCFKRKGLSPIIGFVLLSVQCSFEALIITV